jgi:hypothetical protein
MLNFLPCDQESAHESDLSEPNEPSEDLSDRRWNRSLVPDSRVPETFLSTILVDFLKSRSLEFIPWHRRNFPQLSLVRLLAPNFFRRGCGPSGLHHFPIPLSVPGFCSEKRSCKYGEYIVEEAGEDCVGAVGFWYVFAEIRNIYNSRSR